MSQTESYESMTVAELKVLLEEQGLSKSGKKVDLIERLSAVNEEPTIELASSVWTRTVIGQFNLAQTVGSVAAVLLLILVVFNPSILGFGEDEPVYEPIGFDASQTRWYAQELVNLGHPEWEGRFFRTA